VPGKKFLAFLNFRDQHFLPLSLDDFTVCRSCEMVARAIEDLDNEA